MKRRRRKCFSHIIHFFLLTLTFADLKCSTAEQNDEIYSRSLINPFAYSSDNNQRISDVDRRIRDAAKDNANDKLAAKSSDMALKGAEEAKAAVDAEIIAGRQAAHQVKAQLAKKALDAAKITEAALAGKMALVDQLKEETKETQSVVKESTQALQRSRLNLNAAMKSVHDSHQQAIMMRRAVEIAKSNLQNSRKTAEGARRSLIEKEQLLVAAKKRVDELKARLQKAKFDLAKTSQNARKAQASAREALIKANRNDPPSNPAKI